MKTLLRTAAALAALTLGATPALAVPATQNATATARIIKPLSLTSVQNLDLLYHAARQRLDDLGISASGGSFALAGNVTALVAASCGIAYRTKTRMSR